MAKVTGPLFSISASGSIAKSMVHFGWKGINVVRQWVIPSNPQSANQGDARVAFGGMGRATRAVEVGSAYQIDALLSTPSGKTWVSAIVKYIIDNSMKTGADFDTEYAAYAGHTAKTTFDSEAATLLLTEFDLVYKGQTNAFPAGMQLYELVKYASSHVDAVSGAFNRAPYTTAFASLSGANVSTIAAELSV